MLAHRRRLAAATLALIAVLALMPAAVTVTAANAATKEPANGTSAAPAVTQSPVPTARAVEPPVAEPTVTLNPIADFTADLSKPEQVVELVARVTADDATISRYLVSFRTDFGAFGTTVPGTDGVAVESVPVPVGKHWVEGVLREPESGAEWVSGRQTFEVKPDLRTRTKTTLVLPPNPVAKVKSPYVVKVVPSDGSTGRVDLYEFDNVGQLYRIGVGYLNNGQVAIQAATMAGQRKVIAEFAGDDRYVGSGTGANLFAPVASVPTSPPSNAAAPVSTGPGDQAAAPVRAASAAPRGELAYTGQDPRPVLTFAAALVAAGMALTVAVRRRNRRV